MSECTDHGRHGESIRYASCWVGGKCIDQHVRALVQRTGEQPNGRRALHTCDNKRCINGDHLYWGSQSQNVRDTVGKANSRVKTRVLTDDEVSEVRAIVGMSQQSIANAYGVSRMAIQQIRTGTRR